MPETTETTPAMQCRHVFTDGRRCAAACLRHEPFCYYHHTTRRPIANLPARRRRSATFTLPELEDRAAVQLALAEVLQRIASNDIDPKRAGHLLFGLQIATSLLPKVDPKDKTPPRTVSEITHDEELGDLAPEQKVGADKEPDEWDEILARMEEIQNRKPEDLPAPQPFNLETLPHIQAVADTTGETVGRRDETTAKLGHPSSPGWDIGPLNKTLQSHHPARPQAIPDLRSRSLINFSGYQRQPCLQFSQARKLHGMTLTCGRTHESRYFESAHSGNRVHHRTCVPRYIRKREVSRRLLVNSLTH